MMTVSAWSSLSSIAMPAKGLIVVPSATVWLGVMPLICGPAVAMTVVALLAALIDAESVTLMMKVVVTLWPAVPGPG